MINPRSSEDWSTTNPIAQVSCTPPVQQAHARAEVVHFTPDLLGLGVLFIYHACIAKQMINPRFSAVRPSRLHYSLVHHVYKKYIPKLRSYTMP